MRRPFAPVPHTESPSAERYERWLAARGAGMRRASPARNRVDWADKPHRFCVTHGRSAIALPTAISCADLEIGRRRESAPNTTASVPLAELSDVLMLSTGLLTRKLSASWASVGHSNFGISGLRFSRGVASGGGLYPYCVYVVALAEQPLEAGVYHYDVARHALQRVRSGSYTTFIARALHDPAAARFDFLLVVVGRFWQSAFKYGQFAYKVMMQDAGALLGGMQQVASCMSWSTEAIHWFNDLELAALLGLDARKEAPFVALGVRGSGGAGRSAGEFAPPLPRTAFVHVERSREVRIPRLLLEVHRSTFIDDAPPPAMAELVAPVERAAPGVDGRSLITALLTRETAWGHITDEHPGLSAEALLATISSAFSVLTGTADRQVRLEVIVRNVAGLPSGICRYDEATAAFSLRAVSAPEALERIYAADYHDIEHVPAILVLIGKLRDAVTRYGQRGVRIMNCEAGVFAQRTYVACAALTLGCGAVLGFDSAALSRALGLDHAREVPLLLIFVGARRPRALAFDFRLCD